MAGKIRHLNDDCAAAATSARARRRGLCEDGGVRLHLRICTLALALAGCTDDTAQPTGEPGSSSTSGGEETTGPPPTGATTASETSGTTGEETTTGAPTTGTTGVDTGLCERLGGAQGAQAVAIRLAGKVRADERINAYFLNASVDGGQFIDCLIDQIAVVAGCPGATYACADMQAAHAGRQISQVDFADFVADMAEALAEHRAELAPMLTGGDVAALVGAFEAMQADIVEDPDDDLTLYQRLGRKPGLAAVVGLPGVAGTWLGRVEADDTLSGFFNDAEWQRLQTCLVRQLANIDGPAIYGQEVDAPPGIEVGVSAKSPCAPMQPAHAGVVDQSMGGAPVTADDFVTMVGHLSLALDDAGASDADRMALLAALEPLCPEIVVDGEKCPGQSQTETFEATDLAMIAEDGFYDGTPMTMACHEFEAAADAIDVVTAVEVEVGIDSGHAGDLTIKLVAPGGEIVTLVSRPGFAEAADDGDGCSGDSSNLKSSAPLLFRTGGAKDAETMGDSLAGDQTICLDDMACEYSPNAGAATPGDLAGLAGTTAAGSWQICVGDSCGGFTTTLQVARLTLAQKK